MTLVLNEEQRQLADTAREFLRAQAPVTAFRQLRDSGDPLGLAAGDRVCITPDDYGKIPVEGELVTLTINEVAVRRLTAEAGELVTHFPRLGYRITRA